MSEVSNASKSSISAYRLLGWVPLLITAVGATTVVVASILRDL